MSLKGNFLGPVIRESTLRGNSKLTAPFPVFSIMAGHGTRIDYDCPNPPDHQNDEVLRKLSRCPMAYMLVSSGHPVGCAWHCRRQPRRATPAAANTQNVPPGLKVLSPRTCTAIVAILNSFESSQCLSVPPFFDLVALTLGFHRVPRHPTLSTCGEVYGDDLPPRISRTPCKASGSSCTPNCIRAGNGRPEPDDLQSERPQILDKIIAEILSTPILVRRPSPPVSHQHGTSPTTSEFSTTLFAPSFPSSIGGENGCFVTNMIRVLLRS
ncbi:hypothetical protein EVG20_g8689 [Dentipellis fragilis]|uniref:Uncharacterized protein n=1 Tax=Dentipellis fragilis TaxID=205917 RepID=A0A4Y9Y3L6_9AGAM|nr:hypothetical protein EVG20_g8689 [Dentipellis fragilis]